MTTGITIDLTKRTFVDKVMSLLFNMLSRLVITFLPSVLPVVRVPGRERRLLETMQLAIGEFITDSSQGLPPSPRV